MKRDMFDYLAPIYRNFGDFLFSDIREDIIDNMELGKNDKVLDVGGGTGKLLEKVLEKQPEAEGYLLDKSWNMVKESSKIDSIVLGKACRSPFSSNSFDFVLCTDALHHFENKRESLREMMRVLKPDGEIIILEMDARSLITKIVKLGEKMFGEPSYFFDPDQLKTIFPNNFKVNIDKINSYEYILRAKKKL